MTPEQILKVLDYSVTLFILLVVLFGIFYIARFGINMYIKSYEKYKKLELEDRKKESVDHLKILVDLTKVVTDVKDTNLIHSDEHKDIKKTMEEKNLSDNKIHKKLIEAADQNNVHIKDTAKAVERTNETVERIYQEVKKGSV